MWLVGFAAFLVAGGLVHLLLVIAVISLVATCSGVAAWLEQRAAYFDGDPVIAQKKG